MAIAPKNNKNLLFFNDISILKLLFLTALFILYYHPEIA